MKKQPTKKSIDFYPCEHKSVNACKGFFPDRERNCDFSNICSDNPKCILHKENDTQNKE
jgi:hypothetical protein